VITLADVAAAEKARCEAMVAADLAVLDTVLHDELRYGHTSGNCDAKDVYLRKIEDGRLAYPELCSEITGSLVLGDAVLCWLVVTGQVLLPEGLKALHCSTLTVWTEQGGQARMVAHQPTVLPNPDPEAPPPDRSPEQEAIAS
jgi:hypothetical protein